MNKICRLCNIEKPLEDYHKHSSAKDKLMSICRICSNAKSAAYRVRNPNRVKINNEAFRKRNPGYHRARTYGLSIDDVASMKDKQGNKCAICKIYEEHSSRELVVDHCHRTGRVRGLLCFKCNAGLGQLQDSVEMLKAAIIYLEDDDD